MFESLKLTLFDAGACPLLTVPPPALGALLVVPNFSAFATAFATEPAAGTSDVVGAAWDDAAAAGAAACWVS